jgi:hypothetical protein
VALLLDGVGSCPPQVPDPTTLKVRLIYPKSTWGICAEQRGVGRSCFSSLAEYKLVETARKFPLGGQSRGTRVAPKRVQGKFPLPVPRAKWHLGWQAYRVALQLGHPAGLDGIRTFLKLQVLAVLPYRRTKAQTVERRTGIRQSTITRTCWHGRKRSRKMVVFYRQAGKLETGWIEFINTASQQQLRVRSNDSQKKQTPKKASRFCMCGEPGRLFWFARRVSSRKTS